MLFTVVSDLFGAVERKPVVPPDVAAQPAAAGTLRGVQ